MEITIEGPWFYSEEDENVFFECLYKLPDYEKVHGHGTKLTIQFKSEPDTVTVLRLLVVCRRWGLSVDPLYRFRSEDNSDCSLWDSPISFDGT